MDWYLAAGDREGATHLRHEFADYLSRHASDPAEVQEAVLVFAELVNNGLEHGDGPVWVSVDWQGPRPILSVNDLGPAFSLTGVAMPSPDAARGRGLAIAADLAAHLEVAAKAGEGARVEAELPVERAAEPDFDPPRRTTNVLPALEEAGPMGFGREAFLRSLVVQLAQSVERIEGPLAAEAAVAQVGVDVGSQMEAEYRSSRDGDDEELTSSQLADAYVRLKTAIDGDFYVLEASEDKIILANRRCPFGDAVRQAPALCRITSSVFGGMAARAAGEATVVLEERIAVGDPQCRVVVYLGPRPDIAHGHQYQAPVQ